MKYKTVYLLVFIVLLQVCCVRTGGTPEAKQEEKQLTKEELFLQQLQARADSAYAFCQANELNLSFCFLVDMSMHSGKRRFFVWDFEADSVLLKSLCAHGYGMNSTKKKPVFSNIPESYTTSLGKYKTGARSYSNWGIHIHYKLHGLEETNDKAFQRLIVLHSHTPVPAKDIYPFHLPLGYSQGCPVIDDDTMQKIDGLLQSTRNPTLLWIYSDTHQVE